MAIATTGGHVSRALDFYNAEGKYFIIGGNEEPWDDESAPPPPKVEDYKLRDVIALKKVYNTHLVVPDENGSISYRTQNWKKVSKPFSTTISNAIESNSKVFTVDSLEGMVVGAKLRINNLYEGKIEEVTGYNITLDTAAPVRINEGSLVEGGAYVEGAKYVYVEAYLNYDEFPLETYRQIGLCTGVTPNSLETLRAGRWAASGVNEYSSLGVLEVIDNRAPSTRNIDQRELLSLIIEF